MPDQPDVPPAAEPAGRPGTPPPPPPREVLAAGFTHGDHEDGAQGFAGGGPLDQMEPGSVLAGFASDAWDRGLAVLSDDELVGVLCAARRLVSWASALELTAVAGLSSRRAADARMAGDRRQAEHVGDEVAAALTLTCRAADRLISLAAGVMRLPAAAKALAAGRIDMPKAIIFTDELAGLDDVAAAAVAALVAADAPGLTTGQLRGVLHRAVLALDPDAARKRREKAQKDARVECWTEPAGTWTLAGRDLPPAEVLAADKHVDAAARDLKNAGADGTLEQLRAAVFLALLTSRPLYTLLPGQDEARAGSGDEHADGRAGNGLGICPGRDGHGQVGHDAGRDDQDCDDPGAGPGGNGGGGSRRPDPGPFTGPRGGTGHLSAPAGLTGTVNFTVPLTTWLGLTGQPGEAAGYGHLDAAASRDLAQAITTSPASTWCLTITNPGGHAIGHACARKGQPPPGGPAPPGSPPGRSTPPGGGPPGGGPPGGGPPGQHTGPSPPGSSPGRSTPPGGGPPGQHNGPAPPGPRSPGNSGASHLPWLTGITIRWLETGACGHARETLAYQPSPALRHLLKTRDRTCSFPGCRRTAIRCDDDHTIPYDQGGRTCECNCAALCRRHHRAKQAPGWHLEQPQPGTLAWTLPSARTYTARPGPYPA